MAIHFSLGKASDGSEAMSTTWFSAGWQGTGPGAAGPLLSARRHAAFLEEGARMSHFNDHPNLWPLFPTHLLYRQRFGWGCAGRVL